MLLVIALLPQFTARGLIIEDRGYLEVYHPYEKWSGKVRIGGLSVESFLFFHFFLPSSTSTRCCCYSYPLLLIADFILRLSRF